MDVWIIYSKTYYEKKVEKGTINTLVNYAKDRLNMDVSILSDNLFSIICDGTDNRIYYDGEELTEFPKIVFLKKYDMYLARQFELKGIRVLNTVESMATAKNKLKTYQILTNSGIKVPKSLYISSGVSRRDYTYSDVVELLGESKFIIKPTFGSKGKDIYLVSNDVEFKRALKDFKGICIFQEYIKTETNGDLRAYVINNKYQGAAIRKNENDFRANFNLGAKIYRLKEKDENIRELSVKAAECLGLWYCAVDILKSGTDYYVCEVNSLPGRTRKINTNRRLIHRLSLEIEKLKNDL